MKKGGKLTGWVLFVIYLVILVDVLFLVRGIRGTQFQFSTMFTEPYLAMLKQYAKNAMNLVPLKTIRNYWFMVEQYGINGGNRIWWQNLAGNLVLFLPMGCLLPFLFRFFRSFIRTVLFVTVLVICVEVLQLLTFTGSCDIDDLILNMIGCVAGYLIYKLLFSWRKEV